MFQPCGPLQPVSRGYTKPVVACDCDEVLASFVLGVARFHNERYSTNLKLADFFTYDFSKVWGGTSQECVAKLTEFFGSHHFENLEPITEAYGVLKELTQYFDFVLVTARQNYLRGFTERWIGKHFPNIFKNLLFGNQYSNDGQRGWTKGELCQLVNAVALIDDNLPYLTEASPVVKTAILYTHHNMYGWNRVPASALPPNCVRCASWQEIREVLMGLLEVKEQIAWPLEAPTLQDGAPSEKGVPYKASAEEAATAAAENLCVQEVVTTE